LTHIRKTMAGLMTDGQYIVIAGEYREFSGLQVRSIQLHDWEHHEQRFAVLVNLWQLMAVAGILHCKLMKSEFRLQSLEFVRPWIANCHPHEAARPTDIIADIGQWNVGQFYTTLVCDAVDKHSDTLTDSSAHSRIVDQTPDGLRSFAHEELILPAPYPRPAYNSGMTLSESEFRTQSDAALNRLNRSLGSVAEEHDAEVMFQNGVLTIETEEPTPGKIVVSPNAPVRQIWISALSRSFKLDWNGEAFAFSTGEKLDTLLGRLIGEQLGIDPIKL
jgi:iron donor protein CyaY